MVAELTRSEPVRQEWGCAYTSPLANSDAFVTSRPYSTVAMTMQANSAWRNGGLISMWLHRAWRTLGAKSGKGGDLDRCSDQRALLVRCGLAGRPMSS